MYGFGSRAKGGRGSFQKISERSVVGIMGTNKAKDKETCRFTFPIDDSNSVYVTLTVYPDSTFAINKGRNSGKSGMVGYLTMSKRGGRF